MHTSSLSLLLTGAVLFPACTADPPATAAAVAAGTAPAAAAAPWNSPPTRKEPVADDYHGVRVEDPYRWLEDQDAAEVAAWTASQNAATRALLDQVPERAAIHDRLRELWNYARYDSPERAGTRWFFRKNDGLQNQSVLYVAEDPADEGHVLLDPNGLSTDGTVAVAATALDHGGERLAYATSTHGSDWRTWRVLDVATGQTLPDELPWSKFAGAAWTHDGKGFFYLRYPQPPAGETYEHKNLAPELCYHLLGEPPAKDRVVYQRPDQPEWSFQPRVTEDGRFLVLHLSQGTDYRNRVAVADLQAPDWQVQPLLMDFDASYEFVGNDGDTFFFRTTKDAPRGRLVGIDRTDPAPAKWQPLVAEQHDVLRSVRLVGERFVCHYLADAASSLRLHHLGGQADGEIPLPNLGTASGFTGRRGDSSLFFTFTTFTQPSTVWRYDFADRRCQPLRRPGFGRADDDLATERVFLQSKDGTRLCMFLVHKKGLRLDGRAPCYLWGYGGFDLSTTPGFSVPNLVWIERGGLYAHAILRGGGEYGQAWHHGGMLEHKQNVFDDFIACAEYLQRNGYTGRDRLALGGGSNGGLLVGAVLTQRPELIAAAIPEVGVLDMLRYHRFTIGWAWTSEYGSSDDPQQFAWLQRYSPLHNVRPGVHYPATLVMTGDHDDRVLPGHSYKFAATLQAAQAGPAPVLLRVATNAGHGAGKPVQQQIDEAADRWAFLRMALAH